jgi:hypothetical protein
MVMSKFDQVAIVSDHFILHYQHISVALGGQTALSG